MSVNLTQQKSREIWEQAYIILKQSCRLSPIFTTQQITTQQYSEFSEALERLIIEANEIINTAEDLKTLLKT